MAYEMPGFIIENSLSRSMKKVKIWIV